jgi:hypothetical protein
MYFIRTIIFGMHGDMRHASGKQRVTHELD